MKLIIGGAYQGKVRYAREQYGVTEGWIDGSTCSFDALDSCGGIDRFHCLVKRMLAPEEASMETEVTDAGNVRLYAKDSDSVAGIFSMKDLSALEQQAEAFAAALYQKNPDIVIVSNELGYGVIPVEKQDRLWREAAGRICTALAAYSDEVVRVVCGIGMRLK